MDFLKKHYEKLLLGIVLVGLAGAAACLPFIISSEKEKLNAITENVTNPKAKLLTNIDLTISEAALKRATMPAAIDFSLPHRLFNPITWQQTPPPEKLLIPANKIGPTALTVSNMIPLYIKISFDHVEPADAGPKYAIIVEKPAATGKQTTKHQENCSVKGKYKEFTLSQVKGKPEDPSQLIIELNDTKESAVITKDKPFQRVEGYLADLHYLPEKKSWAERRVGAVLPFNGEEYKVVAINQNEVVLSAKSNGKKWPIPASPNHAP